MVRQRCYFAYHNTFNAMLQFHTVLLWGKHSCDVLISKGNKKWQQEGNKWRADTKHLAISAFSQWFSKEMSKCFPTKLWGFFLEIRKKRVLSPPPKKMPVCKTKISKHLPAWFMISYCHSQWVTAEKAWAIPGKKDNSPSASPQIWPLLLIVC